MRTLCKLIQIVCTKVIQPVTLLSLLNAINVSAIHGGMMQCKKTLLSMFQPNPTIDMFLQSFCLYKIRLSLPPRPKNWKDCLLVQLCKSFLFFSWLKYCLIFWAATLLMMMKTWQKEWKYSLLSKRHWYWNRNRTSHHYFLTSRGCSTTFPL